MARTLGTSRRRRTAVIAGAAAAALSSSAALAQVSTLGKGHSILVNSGLQIWGCDTGATSFTYGNLTGANMNAVMWSFERSNPSLLSTGQKWGKWATVVSNGNYVGPDQALNSAEQDHYADLVAIQVGDEQGDLENPNGPTRRWFDDARNQNRFSDKLVYVNHFGINNVSNFIDFVAAADPDALSFDSYPIGNPSGFTPYNWLGKAQGYRRVALGNYIGASGTAARPYGLYLQTYTGSDALRAPSDVEMRWQQFTAWTMGYSFVDAFTVGGGTTLFNGGNMSSPTSSTNPATPPGTPPRYDQFKESARQGRNLGPALTRLISTGYGTQIVRGQDSAGNTNPVPVDWQEFNIVHTPADQRYLASLSAANFGSKNGGRPGDVYVGFFNPLHASFGEAGDVYFMVTNALGAYSDDPTGVVTDYQQQITLNLDTQYSGISTLQRLRRSDGQLEIVELNRTTARQYQLQFNLDGGTGDLFKYNDGSPFVGVNNTLHWDNDGVAAGNNTGTGAGMGGGGAWDGASSKWYNGSANGAWAGNRDAVFTGTAGTVTLASPQSVNSLAFKSNGYTLTGSTLTMAGQHITTDSGVTTTIGSTIAGSGGIVKAGPGTLVLTNNANSYTGGTTVTGGVLQVSADSAMGPAPASFSAGDIILNGGTLKFGANFDINSNRGISLGPGGGTIDTNGFGNVAGYTSANGIAGVGDLVKTGAGTFFMNTPTPTTASMFNTVWNSRLIIKEGTWKIVNTAGLPINPTDGVFRPGQITLDGGTWQIGASVSATGANRGITATAGGGTIDTQSFNLTWAAPLSGDANAVVNKIGSGILTFTGASALPQHTSTYAGTFNVNGGILRLGTGRGMGDLASINLANTSGVSLDITGNETIGSLSGGGATGGNVTLAAIKLTTGGNNNSTTFAGAISGSTGSVRKLGTGMMTLTGANTYGGTTEVDAGALLVNGAHTGAGNYTVGTNGILGGTGSITLAGSGNSVAVNGVLAPGASIESLNINTGDLTLGSGAKANFEIDLTTGAFDQVNVGDLLTYAGTLNVTFTGSDVDGAMFPIFTFGGGQAGEFSSLVFTGHQPWQTVSFDEATGILTVIPEPTALSLLPLAALLMRRRRRRAERC